MAGFGLLGHLAGGYAQAAEEDNRRKFEAEQSAKQNALGMVKILIENPAVPPEYKAQLIQHGMDVLHAPPGKKLPSFDKVMQGLPAIPGKPNTQPNPAAATSTAMTLPGPQPPPGLPEGTAGPDQLGAGLPPPPPMQIPGAVIRPPAPAPAANIANAGQFHMMSDEEQVGRQTAAKIAAAQAVAKETGVPVERVLGLQPKYSVAPWGAGTFNQQTGEIETAATPKPMGTPIKMKAEDGTYHLYQRFQDNSLRPIDNPNGMSVPLPTAELPTVTQSSHDVNLETGATSTKTVRQKVQPGGKALSMPSAPPGTSSKAAASSSSAASATSGSGPGGKMTRDDMVANRLLMTDAVKASQTARTMVNLLDTQQQYMDTVKAGGAPTPRQDLSLIVAAVRAMNPGTVRLPNKELELELKAGSYGDRMRRYFDTASSGILPADQREDLFQVVNHETSNVAKDAAQNWEQNMSKRPLPPHLKRFAGSGSGASGTNPAQGGVIAVTDPAGGVHYFKDQAGADQFKAALAGAK
jgi:hypothetical protein